MYKRQDYIKPQVNSAIAEACGRVYNTDPEEYKDILFKYQRDLKQSVEDFAMKVNSYIQSKEANFRLNFFVDEVGQFIAGNTRLMLNLQTIAETLYTKTNGNSWVIVTSQEDLEGIIAVSYTHLDVYKRQTSYLSSIWSSSSFNLFNNCNNARVNACLSLEDFLLFQLY